jgi:flagellar hook assembly protein FlgD
MLTILRDIFGLQPPFPGGGGGTAGIEPAVKYRWALNQNSPNPSRSGTEIAFELAEPGRVALRIYDSRGRWVRTLLDERKQAGRHSTRWDGTDSEGNPVSSGVYFCRMRAGTFSATSKMLVVK